MEERDFRLVFLISADSEMFGTEFPWQEGSVLMNAG